MRLIPILQIIFCLATGVLPEGASRFTVSSGYDPKLTWVRQADGQWRAYTATGKDAGVWSVDGLAVLETAKGTATRTDLSPFVRVTISASGQKTFFVNGKVVLVNGATNRLILAQAEGGLLGKAVEIGYSVK